MRWTKEEKLKMALEYKKNGFTPTVEGCSRKTMYNNKRIKSKLKGLSPVQYRIQSLQQSV